MTLEQLAGYVAPVFWLSPDEPTMQRRSGVDISVPQAFPFEAQARTPVVYYQVTSIYRKPQTTDAGFVPRTGKAQAII